MSAGQASKQGKYLDLSGGDKSLALEKEFETIIQRLADLCKPACIRLAGERDYLNLAKELKLKPFRKQHYFDKCIRPTEANALGPRDLAAYASGFGRRREAKSAGLVRSGSELGVRTGAPAAWRAQRAPHAAEELRCAEWPYANPMPECMLVEDNLDNLRAIIVGALEIEWQMLTPKRPESDSELEYLDKLIELHRQRFKYQLECAGGARLASAPTPIGAPGRLCPGSTCELVFKHTRHSQAALAPQRLAVGGASRARSPAKRLASSSMFRLGLGSAALVRRRLSRAAHASGASTAGRATSLVAGGRNLLQIPKLTLTASEDDRALGELGPALASGARELEPHDELDLDQCQHEQDRERRCDASDGSAENYTYEFFSRRAAKRTTTTTMQGAHFSPPDQALCGNSTFGDVAANAGPLAGPVNGANNRVNDLFSQLLADEQQTTQLKNNKLPPAMAAKARRGGAGSR